MLKIGGQNTWFWDVIDDKTRLLVASYIGPGGRTIRDAQVLFHRANRRARHKLKVVLTDKVLH